MLTTTSKHALRALTVLAAQAPGKPMLGHDLARTANVASFYLARIMLTLRRAGIVQTSRGNGGGYWLAVPPEKLPLMDVVRLFEGDWLQTECLLGCAHACSDESPCSAHAGWRAVKAAVLAYLENTTLADITARSTHSGPCVRWSGQARAERGQR